MKNKKNILLTLFCMFLCSCTATRVSSKNKSLPTKSFVKILHTTSILSCKKNYNKKCPIGNYGQMGSGMAIDLFKGQMTVLTAGHVCDSNPDNNKIKNHSQTIHVIDHTDMRHQAWPIHVSFYNKTGKGDLCLLWVPTLKVKKIKISIFEPKIGDDLIYIGAPLGVYHPPTVPIFKGIYSGLIDPSAGIATFPSIGGSSGAAVLDKNKKIVGVVFAANLDFHHISLISSYKSLKVFILEAKTKFNSIQ